MTRVAEAVRGSIWPLFCFMLGTVVFSAVYCQAPLYYSNQHQYFLHGLADAGYGVLQDDWLARTKDSTPLFSALVAITFRYLPSWLFYLYHALVLGIYGAALLGVFVQVVGEPMAGRRWPLFVALFIAVHAALARWCSYQWLGQDYVWFFQSGVAGQYILGPMFQPSMFGVLLIVAITLFLRDRILAAAACAALAAVLHSTYLLPAGMLVLGFLTALVAEGRPYRALGVGAFALVLVLPVIAYILFTFGPTSTNTFAEAQAILVNIRIPHHTRPDLWFDTVAGLQIGWVVLAMFLARSARLRHALAVPSVLAVLLTFIQVATHNDTLALLFPWRVSAVLVPVATTVILSRLVAVLPPISDGLVGRMVSAAVVAVFVVGGVWISLDKKGFHSNDDELPLLNYVRDHHARGDVYMLPVRLPNLVASTRGSLSSDFKPLADKKRDTRVIPVDLQRFRLYTGVPIYVDFKSIPYKDSEVLEWYERMCRSEVIQEYLRQRGPFKTVLETVAVAELRRLGITHLVLPAAHLLEGDGIETVHEDETYKVYRLSRP